jgi:hypothetical protein
MVSLSLALYEQAEWGSGPVVVVVRYEFECSAVMFVDDPSSLGGHLDGYKNSQSVRIGFHDLWSGESHPGRILKVQSREFQWWI